MKDLLTRSAWMASLAVVCALTACGGSGSPAPDAAPTPDSAAPVNTALQAPSLSIAPQSAKTLHFSWADGSGESSYQLLEDADGQSGYQLVAMLPADSTSHDHTVFLPERLNAQYVLRACNDSGCSALSNTVLAGPLASAIGYLKASNAEANDQFGSALAISADGNTLAVGSPFEDSATALDPDNNSVTDSGAVYVFARQGGIWHKQAYLKASNPGGGDRFGHSLALSADGSTLAVGAPLEDSSAHDVDGNQASNSAPDSGAAYVFTRHAGAWAQQAYVKASNEGGLFGISVALAGDGRTLAVGAINEKGQSAGVNNAQIQNETFSRSGAVYVFSRRDNPDTWAQQAYVKASNVSADDQFGGQLALSSNGNTLAVGAQFEDQAAAAYSGGLGTGAVYVFSRNADAVWSEQALLRASNLGLNNRFGASLSLAADGLTLAVGAPLEDNDAMGTPNAAFDSGAAYLFTSDGSVWTQRAYLKAANAEAADRFGTSVALSPDGGTLAVGAPQESGASAGFDGNGGLNGSPNSGAVYLFGRDGSGWTPWHYAPRHYLKAPNAAANQQFGSGVALAGDGLAQSHTLVVGAGLESSGAPTSGAVYLY